VSQVQLAREHKMSLTCHSLTYGSPSTDRSQWHKISTLTAVFPITLHSGEASFNDREQTSVSLYSTAIYDKRMLTFL